ncbi:MAG: potassium-transporting ATPase subunit KdpC [Sedimentisphaerales bacterium]|jgi:K+-transporting ATPase ATPase C chain
MIRILRQAVACIVVFTVITGVIYPLIVTGFAQLVFPRQANGSLLIDNGKAVGSSLIGQSFSSPKYFWARPSATSPMPYNAANSSGSNLGPLNPALTENVKARITQLKAADAASKPIVPVDLVTASGSGLDPDISPASAEYQVARVAKARNLDETKVMELVVKLTKSRQLGILGEPRVNVLELNLALDNLQNK